MPLKIIAISLILISISACSTTPATTQASADTRACNAISYGNKHVKEQSADSIFKQCMSDKKHIRDQQRKDEVRLGWIEFFLTLFWPEATKG